MTYWLGWLLIAYGAFQLLFLDFTVRIKREFKQWWRDDSDRQQDRFLANALRLVTFFVSVPAIELGVYLAAITAVPWYGRALLYGIAGSWYLWRSWNHTTESASDSRPNTPSPSA